jgi:hypothetical protein
MGRGLGEVQRRVLELLHSRPPTGFRHQWSVAELTVGIHGDGYTDSQRRSVARAVSALARRGLVNASLSAKQYREAEVQRPAGRRIEYWDVPIPETLVRLPCTCGYLVR